jgi:outer membrane protein
MAPSAQQRSASAVRKLVLAAIGLVSLAGVSYFVGAAVGEPGRKDAGDDTPHRIGLIDMGHVFNEYDKLKILRAEYNAELSQSEEKAKDYIARIQKQQRELKEFNEGTPEYTKRETQLAALTSEFDTYRKVTQKELVRKEAKMFHTVYLEVQDAVERLCRYHGYTMVLRFSRDELNSPDPQKVMQGINRQVVYHRRRDDMTDTVLKMLNQQFGKASGSEGQATSGPRGTNSKSGVRPASGTRPAE